MHTGLIYYLLSRNNYAMDPGEITLVVNVVFAKYIMKNVSLFSW